MASDKSDVLKELYRRHKLEEFDRGIVKSGDILKAMKDTSSTLGTANPANFLKDLIRKRNVNDNWPAEIWADGVGARQRYGDKRVFQFVKRPGWTAAFIDRFDPTDETECYAVQTASLPHLARSLGRKDETWLTQVAVNLRLVETQLAVYSSDALKFRILDVTHLQMSIKTRPEIDAAYIASYSNEASQGADLNMFVTCEAKQFGERILEDQIIEQVKVAFYITKKHTDRPIDAVKPLAIQVLDTDIKGINERAIYVVEFKHFLRSDFELVDHSADPEAIYDIPLEKVSSTLYVLRPSIAGFS
ncbi:hypothetical protein KZX46_04340 [Polymorphobacter sp. PAMC 29334]|uniref:hypothetical protein n=1 Tax=Polymorphobacter sp. PAMC 29334 TaxID=2862331 RepID=UPI001C750E7C|nr:hypothetical protein [Polymorphobacter sp. PAMC 29334]QYE35236.1 hypothetical protein KZX46_04340 [Polymorphobacter sp. PAMC 29334]